MKFFSVSDLDIDVYDDGDIEISTGERSYVFLNKEEQKKLIEILQNIAGEEPCEWLLGDYDGKKMYNSPEVCGYHATQQEVFIFCPNCGKRIEYKDES